ncbi:MAG: LysR family transcriptional regulator [Minwuia sp.]|uniref:LysR family transcriptional regulator n=1 Tax=Minwuia sp. TaxID=2493630 RepID=UPI003A88A9C9
MRFTLDQIQTFLTVARTANMRQASEELHLTQPAVTARIRNLEQVLGVELFDRSAGMALTKGGVALVNYAEQYLKLNDLILRDVAQSDSVEMLFRIGVSETIVQAWLPEFIASLRETFPRLRVEIDVDISRNLRDRLIGGAIDFALLMGPVSEFSVENVALPSFEIAWFRPPGGDWPEDSTDIFRRWPVITFARGTRPFRLLKETLLERYGPEAMLFPSSSLSACFRLVAAGMGVGALPLALAGPYLESGEIDRFDPGWHPAPLDFTASYKAVPSGTLGARAAAIALETAMSFDKNSLLKPMQYYD